MITVDCMVRTNKNDVVSSTKKFSDRQERNPRKAGKEEFLPMGDHRDDV